jgi:hypothetical protein
MRLARLSRSASALVLLQERFRALGRVPAKFRHYMCIGVHRQSDVRVPKNLHDYDLSRTHRPT